MKPIIFVGGNKGGTGKSLVAMAIIDFLLHEGEKVHVIDTDTGNPDVAKAYRNEQPTDALNLGEIDGWMLLFNTLDANPDSVFVVNMPSRANNQIEQYCELMQTAIPELKREITTVWVIDETIDAPGSAVVYRRFGVHGKFHFVRNWGVERTQKFVDFNKSGVKKEVEEEGGKILDFPTLAGRVSVRLRNDRLSITKAESEMSFGDRIEIIRWRNRVKECLEQIIDC